MRCPQNRTAGFSRLMRAPGRGSEEGFSLIELLVVIIIIGVIAVIAIPTFLSQREKANDTAAYTLVRNALTAVQTAFAESNDYTTLTAAELKGIDATIDWVIVDADVVGVAPPSVALVAADASRGQVALYRQSATIVDVATTSASGNRFGIQIDTVDLSQTGYIRVKVVDGSGSVGW